MPTAFGTFTMEGEALLLEEPPQLASSVVATTMKAIQSLDEFFTAVMGRGFIAWAP